MSTTEDAIRQSQRIVDLRQRMLQNVKEGRPSHEGITPEELRDAIAGLRSNRAAGGARGGTAKAANSSAAATATLNSKLSSLGLDLD
jgi:hypothetical protein